MSINFRHATINDLPDIVRMLADDFLGSNASNTEIRCLKATSKPSKK